MSDGGGQAAVGPAHDGAAAAADAPVVIRHRVDDALLYETMVLTGRKMMARRDPARRRSGWRALGIWVLILVGLAALIDGIRAAELRMEILYVLLGMIFGFAFYTVFLNRSYRRLARMMAANPVYSGERIVTLDPGGAEVRSAGAVNRLDWRAVEGAIQLKHGIALMVPNDLIPLPDAALPEGLTRAELLARIERWREAAGASAGSAG